MKTTPKGLAVALVALLTPLIAALAAFIANEAQILFDMHLDGGALALYISAFVVAVIAALIRLLEHLGGKWMRELVDVLAAATPPAPTPPSAQAPSAPPAPVPVPQTPPAP